MKLAPRLRWYESHTSYPARILRSRRCWPHNAGVEKSTFTPLYGLLRKKLVEMRRAAGLTQRELALRLGREHSFVSRIELAERRLDVVEFFWVCQACSRDPLVVTAELYEDFARRERGPRKTTGR